MGAQACCKLPMGATPWAMACACRAANSWGAFGMSNLHISQVINGLGLEGVPCRLKGDQLQPGVRVCVWCWDEHARHGCLHS